MIISILLKKWKQNIFKYVESNKKKWRFWLNNTWREKKKTRTFFGFYMWYIWNSSSTSNPFFKRESIACPQLSYRWDLSQILFQPVSFVSEKQYSTNSCIKYSIVANIFHTTFNILSTHLCVPPRTHTHISITNEPVHSLYLSIVFSKRSFCSRCFNAR